MDLMQIPFEQFRPFIFDLWDRRWFLLTSGDFASGKYNTMTVSWGSTGILWGKPVFQVVVRPQRYTRLFMEQYDTFTLSVLPEAYRSALNLLGSRSGRDGNKIAAAGLTPTASRIAASPTFAEAELVIECKKLYWADLDPTHFINPALDQNYPRKDYHRQYFGEVLAIYGTRNYMDQG